MPMQDDKNRQQKELSKTLKLTCVFIAFKSDDIQ